MRSFTSVLSVITKHGTAYATKEGYVLHRGDYPLLTGTPSDSLVYYDGTKFHCPRSGKSYDPPIIVVSIFGVSYIEHGSLRQVKALDGLVVWIGYEASNEVDLDIVIPRTLGS